jgi:hypothetical protein
LAIPTSFFWLSRISNFTNSALLMTPSLFSSTSWKIFLMISSLLLASPRKKAIS